MTPRPALSLAILLPLLACKPDPAVAHRMAGEDAMGKLDFKGAAAEFAQSVALAPAQPVVLEKLAFCRLKAGDEDGAAQALVRLFLDGPAAIQLIKNIEQRKHTIVKVCQSIIRRQRDFFDHGIEHIKPMMIKEVAEEVGVHPSTVSRAVASKYAHTPQGVFELRFFFSESVNGPEGGNISLMTLKRHVKKMIEEEDTFHPLTDEQIAKRLEQEGVRVTRRTVAKYREDLRIPSTHQRRVKS